MTCRLYIVPPLFLSQVWHSEGVREQFQNHEHRGGGTWTVDQLFESFADETRQLWVIVDHSGDIFASLATSVHRNADGTKTASVDMIVGQYINKWIELTATLEHWARANDCDYIEAIGRPGWKKYLDWPAGDIIYRKKLETDG